MTWRYSYSWTLFFVFCAALALALQSEWPQRIIAFLVMTVPLTLLALYWMRKQA